MRVLRLALPLLAIAFVACFLLSEEDHLAEASCIGVDFGTEWMKVALVKPASPIEIVENEMTKRKSPAGVAFRSPTHRILGEELPPALVSHPSTTFINLKRFLGVESAAEARRLAEELLLPFEIKETGQEEGSWGFVVPAGEESAEEPERVYTLHELLALTFHYVQKLAAKAAGDPVKDAVLTVPSSFSQQQRRAFAEAAEVGGLKVLSLISEAGAAAVHYGLTRRPFDGKEQRNVLLYDAGASSVEASVLQFTPGSGKGKNRIKDKVQVLSSALEEDAGGLVLDRLLIEMAMREVQAKSNVDLHQEPRAVAKLRRECRRIKEILSANNQHVLSVESLHNGEDFSMTITRDMLEQAAQEDGVFERAMLPVQKALDAAGLTMSDIHSVELIGGGMRVPGLQNRLKELVGSLGLSFSLNSDESAAMGAAFTAARFSPSFHVESFELEDLVQAPLHVFANAGKGHELVASFPGPHVPGTFLHQNIPLPEEDASVEVVLHTSADWKSDEKPLYKTKITGLASALKFLTKETEADNFVRLTEGPTIRAELSFDTKGLMEVHKASMLSVVEVSEPVQSGGATSSKKKKAVDKEEEEQQPAEGEEGDKKKEEEEARVVTRKLPYPLRLENDKTLMHGCLPGEVLDRFGGSVRSLDEADQNRKRLGESRNALESFIFSTRDSLEAESVMEVSTEEVREQIAALLSEADDWMWEEGEHASADTVDQKLKDLRMAFDPVAVRADERLRRPDALRRLEDTIAATRAALDKELKKLPPKFEMPKHLKDKVDVLTGLLEELEGEITEMRKEIADTDPLKDLSFKAADVDHKGRSLQRKEEELERVVRREVDLWRKEQRRKLEEERKAKKKAEKKAAAKEKKESSSGEEEVQEGEKEQAKQEQEQEQEPKVVEKESADAERGQEQKQEQEQEQEQSDPTPQAEKEEL